MSGLLLYPAIDVLEGQCVMLLKGRAGTQKVYYPDPRDAARKWEEEGAEALHVVDLDGTLFERANPEAVKRIVDSVGIPVQLGGGLRSRQAVENAFQLGVWRVVLGTAALTSRDLLRWALDAFGDRIVVALDSRGQRVVISGWQRQDERTLEEAGHYLRSEGVTEVLATSVERDGTMEGPDLESLRNLIACDLGVIASGGVSGIEDIRVLRTVGPNLKGAVMGKALYEGVLSLREALEVSREPLKEDGYGPQNRE